ncbi:MAG: nicotinate (nicotinamide) nucleotide adenylyltransferase [Myxococcaceae bacterium]|nr:nicotinate (nicotinamide) nucleotide adenylyltransferase [Myxococcaceae bacterium]
MREVALLGGSFNPPHVGHVMAAVYVRSTLPVDEVWLMPSFHHPFGKSLTPFEHRVKMCQAMAADIGPWLKVTEVEAHVPGDGRTIDTLRFLMPQQPETQFRLIIGSDILNDLPQWKEWPEIQKRVTVTVVHRAGYPGKGVVGPGLAVVSSTEIRRRFEAGDDVSDLVPKGALAYARKHRLFGL